MCYTSKRRKWEKSYIDKVFKNQDKPDEKYFDILFHNEELINAKSEYIPESLYKYYSPTSDNILDIENKRIWFSHPNNFNDPFDCLTGHDYLKYEKESLLNYIDKENLVDNTNINDSFTKSEINKIINSTTSLENSSYVKKYYSILKINILSNKSDKFQDEIRNYIEKIRRNFNLKIKKMRDINIRVACFSRFKNHKEFYKKIQMWSHYADNHKGFCVEYDLSELKQKINFLIKDHEYYDNRDEYLNEKVKATIKGGLFPVNYSSRRVNIPYTKVKKLKIKENGALERNKTLNKKLFKTFLVKSTNWSYENEWRIIIEGDICDYFDNKIPFPYIKKIYLGCNMNKKNIDALIEIGKKLNVEVVMLKMNNSKYILEESSIDDYKWSEEQRKFYNPFTR
ncbi:Protein of unknown function (DUF2971) [Halanaerobium congolense]|jgi:hypothetical protein|uniref:DUF2971 family protein n=2 Tax=Halanaerobium congolense TaxID=54121 RepID=A0A4R7E099_9FIRM|nr:Protein of unknown function (DUF2971) [Halanaerobium congolense]